MTTLEDLTLLPHLLYHVFRGVVPPGLGSSGTGSCPRPWGARSLRGLVPFSVPCSCWALLSASFVRRHDFGGAEQSKGLLKGGEIFAGEVRVLPTVTTPAECHLAVRTLGAGCALARRRVPANPDHSSCTLRARDVCCIRLLTAAAAAAAAVAAAAAPSLLLSIVVGLERNILVEVSG